MSAICELCGEPIDPRAPGNWQRVTGWGRRGRAGGSDIVCREYVPDRWAHNLCVRRAQDRVHPQQTSLAPDL